MQHCWLVGKLKKVQVIEWVGCGGKLLHFSFFSLHHRISRQAAVQEWVSPGAAATPLSLSLSLTFTHSHTKQEMRNETAPMQISLGLLNMLICSHNELK